MQKEAYDVVSVNENRLSQKIDEMQERIESLRPSRLKGRNNSVKNNLYRSNKGNFDINNEYDTRSENSPMSRLDQRCSLGNRAINVSRSMKFGSVNIGQATHRQYDSVAESLYRIQNKLTTHTKNRNKNIQRTVSRLSRNSSELSLKRSEWSQKQFDQNEANLLKNVNKALLIEKKQKQQAKTQQQKSKQLAETTHSKYSQFQTGSKDL